MIDLSTTSQHIPIDTYKENLAKIVNHPNIRGQNATICLLPPPPIDEIKIARVDKEWGHPEPSRRAAVSAAYSEKVREVARENPHVQLVDIWQAIMDAAIAKTPGDYQPGGPWLGTLENGKQGGLDELLTDGVHLSGEAYEVFFETIQPHIALPQKKLFPEWNELNPMTPEGRLCAERHGIFGL